MDRDIQTYRMRHLLKSYIATIKQDNAEDENTNICLNILDDSHILAPDGKRNQLIEQIISQAKITLRRVCGEKQSKQLPETS